jgi:hypothetical protein
MLRLAKKKTGVYNDSGQDAHSQNSSAGKHKVDAIFDRVEAEFHAIAAERGLAIARGMIPIDTHTLQKSIQAFRQGNATIIAVPDATLFYSIKPNRRSALAIALILEAGYHKGPKPLQRTQSNTLPGTAQGQPTKDWFAIAGQQMQATMQPIAARLLQAAINEALNAINDTL